MRKYLIEYVFLSKAYVEFVTAINSIMAIRSIQKKYRGPIRVIKIDYPKF